MKYMEKEKRFLDPQKELFLSYYTNPKSETFSNAKQSALKAGYSETYSDNIMALMPEWLFDNIGDFKRLRKAEKVLDETLEINTQKPVEIKGEIKMVEDSSLLKIKQDTAKFVAERLNKQKYSTRIENTGKDGKELPTPIIYVPNNNSIQENSETE